MIETVLGFLWLLLAGWFCTRSPLWLAKFIDRYVVGDMAGTFRLQRNREFAAYIREHPESWHLRYPLLFRMIRLTGWLSFTIIALGFLIMFLASIGVAKVGG